VIAHNTVDMSLSKKLTDSFKEHMEQNHIDMKITFSVAVLGKAFWPIGPPEDGFIVPTDIQLTYDRFQGYYQSKHSGRKLMWLWSHSNNEVRADYSNKNFIFITSTYQMAVLLQYNNNDRLSLDKLATTTNLKKDSDLLTRVLQPLVKSGILINDETDQYDFNPGASDSLMRIIYVFFFTKDSQISNQQRFA
jgi:cullin 1